MNLIAQFDTTDRGMPSYKQGTWMYPFIEFGAIYYFKDFYSINDTFFDGCYFICKLKY